jgi:hypothetical protein
MSLHSDSLPHDVAVINQIKTNLNENDQIQENLHQISPLFSVTHAELHYSTVTGEKCFYQTSLDIFSLCSVYV